MCDRSKNIKANKILLLHGAIGSADQLLPLANLLKGKFEPITLNFSGHGGRDFKNLFKIEQFADDVIEYLDKNLIDSINIFGYSMGGYVGLYLAKFHPNRIDKVITLGTKFKWNVDIAKKEVRMLDPVVISEKIPAFAMILEKRHRPNDWKLVLNKTGQMMLEMGMNNPLSFNDFKQIKQKVKIGIAENDEMVSLEETKDVFNAIKSASFFTLKNSKHPIEKVDLKSLSDEIINFI